MTKTKLLAAAAVTLTAAPGCLGLFAAAALADAIPCDGKLLDELEQEDGLSDECRADIAPYLPDPEDNFTGLVALGHEVGPAGGLSVYLQGDAANWPDAQVTVWMDGTATIVDPADLHIEDVGDSAESLVSIAMVDDYSASMLDSDLDDVEALQLDIAECLPPGTEAAVTYFSEVVTPKLDFTEDRDQLASAVRRDDEIDRSMTALYDGMGSALEGLVERDRPVRVLLVSSDGLENASSEWTRDEILDMVEAEDVVVVMLGALFANRSEMEALTRHGGVYFYTPFYAEMGEHLDAYVASLKQMARITIPPAYADADAIEVTVNGATTTIDL